MKSKVIESFVILGVLIYSSISGLSLIYAQSAMINVSSRHCTSLNGKWQAIIDPTGAGDWRQVWQERKPEKKTDFIEFGNADSLRHSIGNTVLLDTDVNDIRHVAGQRQVQHRLGKQKDKYKNNCPNERLEMLKKFCHL